MLGANVRRYREMLGISQEELAKRVGMTQGAIGHIERGMNIPRLTTLYALADALGVTVGMLADREPEPASNLATD